MLNMNRLNLANIYEGWRNNLFPPKHLKKLIQQVKKERMQICNECPHHSKNHKTIRRDYHCIICGCTLSAKTACLSCACPEYKWREVMNSEQEEELTQAIESYGNKENSS
jgi:hypothetical protein